MKADDSYYLPPFEGVAHVSKIADISAINEYVKQARECQTVASRLLAALGRQKEVIKNTKFTYEMRCDVWTGHCANYIVSAMAIPSNPDLSSFRVDGTYAECYCLSDAYNHARKVVVDLKSRGIEIEFDMETMKDLKISYV